MSDFTFGSIMVVLFVAAFVLGSILTSFTSTFKTGKEAKAIIEQCELSLPRDEFCELVALPKE